MWLSRPTKQQLDQVITKGVPLLSTVVTVVESALNLDVTIDSQLSMDVYVAALCRSSHYQLRQLRPLTRSLSTAAAKTAVQTVIVNRLDYCNSLLYGVANGLMSRLSLVHTSNNVEATFDFVAKKATMSNAFFVKISPFRQSRTFLRHCCPKRQHCRSNRQQSCLLLRQCCFDIIASVDRALQSVQNAAARLVTGARRCDDMTPILRQLYWLPVRMAVLVFQCLVGQSPSYVGRRLSSRLRRPSVPFPVIRFIDVRRSTHTQRLRLSVFCCSRAAGFELLACWLATMQTAFKDLLLPDMGPRRFVTL